MGEYKNVSLDSVLLPERDSPLMPPQFVQNAGVGTLNVISTGQITMPAVVSPNSSTSVTVLHGQNYQPLALVFVKFSATGTRRLLPYNEIQSSIDPSPGASRFTLDYEMVNNTSLTFFQRYNSGSYPSASTVYYFEWYILKEILR